MFWSNNLDNSAQLLDLIDKSGAIDMVGVINIQSKAIPYFVKT